MEVIRHERGGVSGIRERLAHVNDGDVLFVFPLVADTFANLPPGIGAAICARVLEDNREGRRRVSLAPGPLDEVSHFCAGPPCVPQVVPVVDDEQVRASGSHVLNVVEGVFRALA